jgi:hypothetical protein
MTKHIWEKLKDKLGKFECHSCCKKVDNKEAVKNKVYFERWYGDNPGSAVEAHLCDECAAPIIPILKRARANQSILKKQKELDPHDQKKPYHFDN